MDVIELNGLDGCTDHRVKKLAGWSTAKGGGEWNQIQLAASPKCYSSEPAVFNISDLD